MKLSEVVSFVESFIQAECQAKQAYRKPEISAYNNQVKRVNACLDKDMLSSLGMDELDAPKPAAFYEKISKAQPITPRYLFRVDLIEAKAPLFRAFVSDLGDTKGYFDCFIIQEKNDKLSISSLYTWGYGRSGENKKHWYLSGGKDIGFDKAKVIETLRVQPPEDDQESMEQYMS